MAAENKPNPETATVLFNCQESVGGGNSTSVVQFERSPSPTFHLALQSRSSLQHDELRVPHTASAICALDGAHVIS